MVLQVYNPSIAKGRSTLFQEDLANQNNGSDGGFFEIFCKWMCLVDFKILAFALLFVAIVTHQYTNFVQILLKLGAFYANLL